MTTRTEALGTIVCARCRAFAAAETVGEPILADTGSLTFAGGSPEAIVAHFGALHGALTNRTCPDSHHQIVWRRASGAQPAWTRIELVPGALGPKPTTCPTCAQVRALILVGERALEDGATLVSRSLWPRIAEKYGVAPDTKRVRCPDCGRPAHAETPIVSVSEHPDPAAAVAQLPRLDCARCDAFVTKHAFYARRDLGGLAIEGVSETLHGALVPHRAPDAPPGPLRMGEDLRCSDCGREVWIVETPRSAGYLVFALTREPRRAVSGR